MRLEWLLAWALVAGCRETSGPSTTESTKSAPPQPTSAAGEPLPPTSPSPSPSPSQSASQSAERMTVGPAMDPLEQPPKIETLWQESADLDGDGDVDEISLTSAMVRTTGDERADEQAKIPVRGCRDGGANCIAALEVGSVRRELTLTPGYFGGIDLSVIDVDTNDQRKEILFRRRREDNVDPPFIFSVGVFDGEALHWQELEPGFGYDAGTISVSGHGTLTTEYDACSELTRTTYRLTKAGLKKEKTTTTQVRDPSECPACPSVYLEQQGEWIMQGEILRHLRSPKLNGHQSLRLAPTKPSALEGLVHIQLREEKSETTYLDSIWLEAGGAKYLPSSCGNEPYCNTDGRFHTLHEGKRLDLYFRIPEAVGELELQAVGHYVPHRRARPNRSQ